MKNGSQTLRVLLVEDDNNDVSLIVRMLERSNGGHKVIYKAVDTEAALFIALDQRLWDVVLCDYRLPVLSPYRALEIVKSNNYTMPFIVVSGSVKADKVVDLLKAGADGFISKDEDLTMLFIVIKRALEQVNDKKYQDERTTLKIAQSYDMTIKAFVTALETRDPYTQGHTIRVTDMTLRLAHLMPLSSAEFEAIYHGSLLHDIGKISIPDQVLLKPSALTAEERSIMERHPVIAYGMLSNIPFLKDALNIPYCHHEKWDGSGYPKGLHGEDIPFEARMFSVADVYDALTSDRPYRKSWSQDKALEYLLEQKGKAFDPDMVDAFVRMREKE